MKKEKVKYDCRHFKGHIPCEPNKKFDVQCDNCSHYECDPSAIIKLDTKQDHLDEIYKICNFKNTDSIKENSNLKELRDSNLKELKDGYGIDAIGLTDTETDRLLKAFGIGGRQDFFLRSVPLLLKSMTTKILFIKLGAIGDVIRTTPLLERFREKYGDCHFTWITHSPEVVPKDDVNLIFKWNESSISHIATKMTFDIAVNLDKDKEACMLLSAVDSDKKFGFSWKDGHINIATEKAEHKLITGFFDHISKKNTKNYLEEIFEICHFDFNGEKYMINLNKNLSNVWRKKFKELAGEKTIIGLNTGCGLRWKTRLWPSEYWVEFINHLEGQGYFCLLMGGPDEDEKNKYYTKETNATYLGTFSLEEFIAITNNTDIIVTPVSMMMHIALALRKQLMLFHNIFNIHEFELYGRGIIIEPKSGCDCYFGNACSREKSCMYDISVQDVLTNIAVLNQNLKKLKI